jgi:hypothetical protein
MRRIGGLYEQIADPDNLREAMAAAARGKRDRPSVRRFLRHASEELRALRAQLCAGDVAVDGYRFFMVYDPKPRRIAAPSFRDRVLHHALMRVVEPVFEAEALGASFACRKGKGLHRAVAQLRHETRRSRYFLQRDVSRFFDSVDHAVLRRALARKFKEEVLLRLFDVLLSSYEVAAGKGLPIGSLVFSGAAKRRLRRKLKVARVGIDAGKWSAAEASARVEALLTRTHAFGAGGLRRAWTRAWLDVDL